MIQNLAEAGPALEEIVPGIARMIQSRAGAAQGHVTITIVIEGSITIAREAIEKKAVDMIGDAEVDREAIIINDTHKKFRHKNLYIIDYWFNTLT